jgi:hypothetical protein
MHKFTIKVFSTLGGCALGTKTSSIDHSDTFPYPTSPILSDNTIFVIKIEIKKILIGKMTGKYLNTVTIILGIRFIISN